MMSSLIANRKIVAYGISISRTSLTLLFWPLFHLGVWASLTIPQTSNDVIKGRMVTLQASYNSPGVTDPSGSTVIWNFVSNNTQLVRRKSEF